MDDAGQTTNHTSFFIPFICIQKWDRKIQLAHQSRHIFFLSNSAEHNILVLWLFLNFIGFRLKYRWVIRGIHKKNEWKMNSNHCRTNKKTHTRISMCGIVDDMVYINRVDSFLVRFWESDVAIYVGVLVQQKILFFLQKNKNWMNKIKTH